MGLRQRPAKSPTAVFVLPSLNGGGAERATLNLHHHCALDTKIIVERQEGDLLDDPMAHDAIVVGTPARAGRARRIAELVRILRGLRPAVVVAVLSPLTAALAARAASSRTLFWLQNPSHFVTGIGPHRHNAAERASLWTLALLADAVAGAAPGLMAEWATAGVRGHKLTVLPNGVDLPAEVPRRRCIAGSSPLQLLTIGRLAPQKRHDILIRALRAIHRHRAADLTILGRGDAESELRALAESLDVADHVHFKGFVTNPSAYLAAAGLFVLASDFEGFGNVIVEALGHGLPVVCTDAPYGPGFIARGCQAVRLVPLRDPDAIAREVLYVAEQPSDVWSEAARARAEKFSVERISAHFEALIEQLMRGGQLPSWQDDSTTFP
jgi:glycosyltransferase involved in cell wall biosynthesis